MSYIELASAHVADIYPLIVYAQPPLTDLPNGAIIGTWSYSVPGKVRFILSRELELSPGVLPADVARAWIRDAYALPFKRRANQLDRNFKVPLHARRGDFGECSYVDIKGAYLRILGLGYDLEYRPNAYIGADPQRVPDEIAKNKFCYSIAVTMSGSKLSNLQIKGKEGLFDHKPMNLFSNPCLYALAQDTLNAIGSEMLALLGEHCHYANTDGYIVDAGYEKFAIDIINSWGFRSSVKASGNTSVYGVGAWKVGDEKTKRLNPAALDFTGELMSKDERLWLKRRWQRWSTKLE